MRVGLGFDVHAFSPDRKLILAGIEIPYEFGLLGHSDADVVLHAIMDAMLGALALGDIGQHFPDSDMRYADVDSRILAAKVWQMVGHEGYTLGNMDVMLLAEAPKIAPYVLQMRESLARIFNADIKQISIKATTMEKMGFIGRREGIAAEAVVILKSISGGDFLK